MQCLPLPLSLKPPPEGSEQILAAQAKPPTPTGRTEQFVPGGSVYDGAQVYQVQAILGEGTFGKVAKCLRMADKKIVAIKMIKKRGSCVDAQKEVALLNTHRLSDFSVSAFRFVAKLTKKMCVLRSKRCPS